MCASLHPNQCVCSGANMHVNVGIRKWILLNLWSHLCLGVLGAKLLVNVCVREWVWLNVRESA